MKEKQHFRPPLIQSNREESKTRTVRNSLNLESIPRGTFSLADKQAFTLLHHFEVVPKLPKLSKLPKMSYGPTSFCYVATYRDFKVLASNHLCFLFFYFFLLLSLLLPSFSSSSSSSSFPPFFSPSPLQTLSVSSRNRR